MLLRRLQGKENIFIVLYLLKKIYKVDRAVQTHVFQYRGGRKNFLQDEMTILRKHK